MKTTIALVVLVAALAGVLVAQPFRAQSVPTLAGADREVVVETLRQVAARDRNYAELFRPYSESAASYFTGRADGEDSAATFLATYGVPAAAASHNPER